MADFGTVNYSGSAVIDSANTRGTLSSFNADQITMDDNGTVRATPSNLSPDGSAFSVTWDNPRRPDDLIQFAGMRRPQSETAQQQSDRRSLRPSAGGRYPPGSAGPGPVR
jgi:hypothetical protein